MSKLVQRIIIWGLVFVGPDYACSSESLHISHLSLRLTAIADEIVTTGNLETRAEATSELKGV